jgi:hypothetical protein
MYYLVIGSGQTSMRYTPQKVLVTVSYRLLPWRVAPVDIKLFGASLENLSRALWNASIAGCPMRLMPTEEDGI